MHCWLLCCCLLPLLSIIVHHLLSCQLPSCHLLLVIKVDCYFLDKAWWCWRLKSSLSLSVVPCRCCGRCVPALLSLSTAIRQQHTMQWWATASNFSPPVLFYGWLFYSCCRCLSDGLQEGQQWRDNCVEMDKGSTHCCCQCLAQLDRLSFDSPLSHNQLVPERLCWRAWGGVCWAYFARGAGPATHFWFIVVSYL